MEQIYLKKLLSSGVITLISSVLKINSSGYPYITVYNSNTFNTLYFAKKTAEKISDLGITRGMSLPENFLENCEVICTNNSLGDIRHKLSYRGDNPYKGPNDLAEIFDAPQLRSPFNIKQFKDEFIKRNNSEHIENGDDNNNENRYDDPTDSGYDDETIDDAFEGDSDNTWNTD